jgi:hypothetical protein
MYIHIHVYIYIYIGEAALLELSKLAEEAASKEEPLKKYEFDRKFLFRVLVLGNAQLAQIVKVYMCVCMCVFIYVCVCMCMYICMCIHIHIYIYTCRQKDLICKQMLYMLYDIYKYIYIYIYINTYIYIYTNM